MCTPIDIEVFDRVNMIGFIGTVAQSDFDGNVITFSFSETM
jgi:hypothetical protein